MILIVIPVLNEAKTIVQQLQKLTTFLEANHELSQKLSFTIFDNGSTDNTFSLANEFSRDYEFLKVQQIAQRGVGVALKSAWSDCTQTYLGYMDLDFSTDLRHLIQIVDIFESNSSVDFIYGSRWSKQSKVLNRKKSRKIVSYFFNVLTRRVFGLHFSDFMCGFKFLKCNVYSDISSKFELENNWFFCAEILISSQFLGKPINVHELPIFWEDDLNSKVVIHRVTRVFLRSIFRFKRQLMMQR
jgi:glycosyltransferase involved in cell wall biosynthesis